MRCKTNANTSLLISVFFVSMACSIAAGRTIYVDDDGPADFSNIQAAINASNNGDTVLVADGTYKGSGNRSIRFNGKAITVKSENGPDNCMVDCQHLERGFYFHSGDDSNSVLDGFTITNAFASNGGGIANFGGSPTVMNCTLSANSASASGGGMRSEGGSPFLINCTFIGNVSRSPDAGGGGFACCCGGIPMLTNCTFIGNSATEDGGGGMYCNTSSPIVTNCVFRNNWSKYSGGGMFNYYNSNTKVSNCIFSGNSSWRGGGIRNYKSSPKVTNCTFFGNSASDSGNGMNNRENSYPMVTNCIFWNGANEITNELSSAITITYSDVQGGWPGAGNINANPLFVEPAIDDYHLLPGSPCIDAGDNTAVPSGVMTDLGGNPRIEYGTVDMGAYEYYSVPVTIYVEANAAGANNGSNWADAFNDLQDALAVAENGDEILVAQGIYKPADYVTPPSPLGESMEQATTTAVSREATFQLKNRVVIKGGYVGFGQPDPNARDIRLYETILSGDIAGNDREIIDPRDMLNDPCRAENSYHIVTGSGTDGTALLDGFTITSGNANNHWSYAHHSGGGMFNENGSPTLTNCTFSNNSAEFFGGGMANWDDSGPTLVNCTFSGNSALWGGGVDTVQGSVTLSNCTFNNNSAVFGWGGGMGNWNGSATLTNCAFFGNSADYGGGIRNYNSSTTVVNCTFTANTARLNGGGMYNDESSRSMLANCILWGNKTDQIYLGLNDNAWITYSDVQGGWPGEGNINADPCFVELGFWADPNDPNIARDPTDPNAIWIDGDHHLLADSPCINAGDPEYIPEPNETDLDGNPRVIGGRIDMGAYEFFNTRPVADAGDGQVVECACNTAKGTQVTLDGSGSYDADGDQLTFTWTGPFAGSPAHGATPIVTLEAGCPDDYVITLVINDGTEDSEPDEVVITVVDTTPPDFELSLSPAMLWPPDHKMYEITPIWTVNDECDAAPQVSLVDIVMSEGDNTVGDGHTTGDIDIGEDGSIYLRSERSGTGSDRVYTITYQAVDDCGNTTVRSATVSIPHDFKVLARIAAKWLWANPSGRIPEDLNGDGFVNLADFARFAENWIK